MGLRQLADKRLSEISSDEEAFKKVALAHQEEFQKNGFSHTLKFTPTRLATRINRDHLLKMCKLT